MPLPGVYTFCFHPNAMEDKAFAALESFIKSHKREFSSFDELDLREVKNKSFMDIAISWLYFLKRKI